MRSAILWTILTAGICQATVPVGRTLWSFDLTDREGNLVASRNGNNHSVLIMAFDSTCTDCLEIFRLLGVIEKSSKVEVFLVDVDGAEGRTLEPTLGSLKRSVYFPNISRRKFMDLMDLKSGDLPYAYLTDSEGIVLSAAPGRDLAETLAGGKYRPAGPKEIAALLSSEDQDLDPEMSEQEEKRLLALLELHPDDHITQHALGKLYGARGDQANALIHYMVALENSPESELSHYASHVLKAVERIRVERDDYTTYLTASGIRLPVPYMENEINKALELIRNALEKNRQARSH